MTSWPVGYIMLTMTTDIPPYSSRPGAVVLAGPTILRLRRCGIAAGVFPWAYVPSRCRRNYKAAAASPTCEWNWIRCCLRRLWRCHFPFRNWCDCASQGRAGAATDYPESDRCNLVFVVGTASDIEKEGLEGVLSLAIRSGK